MANIPDSAVEVRALSFDAYDAAFALWRQCEGIGLSPADSREGIQRYLERNLGMSFIAVCGGNVVGAALCGHDGRRGYLHHLAVHPGYRRRSIGRRLVEYCLKALAREGIQKCHLFVMNHNLEGSAFWKALGWTSRNDIGIMSKNIEVEMPGAWMGRSCPPSR